MRAMLYCDEWDCGAVWGYAKCPHCKNILAYVDKREAFCETCKEFIHFAIFKKHCPRCYSMLLFFKKEST